MEPRTTFGPPGSTFSLGDETADDTERFFTDIPGTSRGMVAKFEVDESDVAFTFASPGIVPVAEDIGVVDRACQYADIRRYTSLFAVDTFDVAGRAFRACVPLRGLLEPPLVLHAQAPGIHEDDENGEENDSRISGDGDGGSRGRRRQPPLVPQHVEFTREFNDKPDLVGFSREA
jgi:hypothetical protein